MPHDSPSGWMRSPTYVTRFVVEYSRPPYEQLPSGREGPRVWCFLLCPFNVGQVVVSLTLLQGT